MAPDLDGTGTRPEGSSAAVCGGCATSAFFVPLRAFLSDIGLSWASLSFLSASVKLTCDFMAAPWDHLICSIIRRAGFEAEGEQAARDARLPDAASDMRSL